jgi:hypothetical protein
MDHHELPVHERIAQRPRKRSKQQAQTAAFAVRVFAVALIAAVPHFIAVSKLRRPLLHDFFIVVRLLRWREKFAQPDFALLARAFNRVIMGLRPTHSDESHGTRHPRASGGPRYRRQSWIPAPSTSSGQAFRGLWPYPLESYGRQAEGSSLNFSPRTRKGGVLTPPIPTLLTVSPSRAPRSPSADGLRGARGEKGGGSRFAAGLKPRPSDPLSQKGVAWREIQARPQGGNDATSDGARQRIS